MKRFFRSILDHTFLPVMSVVVLGLAVSALVAYFHTRSTVEELAIARLDQSLDYLDKSVSTKIQDVAYSLKLWSHEDVFRLALQDTYLGHAARDAANRRLQARIEGGPFDRILLVDGQGAVLAASNPDLVGAFSVADRRYFKKAMSGEANMETILSGRYNGLPLLIMAAPVKDAGGKTDGALCAVVETASFSGFMLRAIRPDENDSAYIIDPSGTLLAFAGNARARGIPARILREMGHASDATQGTVSMEDEDGRILLSQVNSQTGWVIAVAANADEVKLPASRLAAISAAISACTILLVIASLGALRRAIKELKISERKARTLTEASPVGIVTMNASGSLTYMNGWARRIFGLEQGDDAPLPDTLALRTASGEDIDLGALTLDAAFGEDAMKTGLFAWGMTKGGDQRALILNVARLSPTEAVVTMEDDTQRRLSEEKLRQSEEIFSRIFDLAPECILITRVEDGVAVSVNSYFEKLSGFKPEQLIGKSPVDLGLWKDLAARGGFYDRIMRDGRVDDFEFKLQTADGGVRQCLVSSRLIHLSGSLCAISIVRDITEQTQMNEVMAQSEKMISVGGLAAGMAHELNNPLGIISMAAQNLERRLSPDNPKNLDVAGECGLDLASLGRYMEKRDVYGFFRAIQEASGRAAKIIRSMLHFSQSKRSPWGECEVNFLVDQALELAMNEYDPQRGFDLRKIAIAKDYALDLPPIPCADTELVQVLLNLIKNAGQSMASMGTDARPELSLETSRVGNMARIVIADNGPGMEESVRKRVFEPFFTTKVPGEGTGLGLSVSYFIITQKHQGRIRVESEPGKGARFILELPFDAQTEPEASSD